MNDRAPRKSLTFNQRDIFVYLALALTTTIVMAVYSTRIHEDAFSIKSFLLYVFIFSHPFLIIYGLPLLTDAYDLVMPIPATIFMSALLIFSTPTPRRMILEHRESDFSLFIQIVGIMVFALFLSLLYTVIVGMASKARKISGEPPLLSHISAKTRTLMLIILSTVLLVTGITSTVIHRISVNEQKSYIVSVEDYSPLLNFTVVGELIKTESVAQGLLHTNRYSAIEGVDHREFLHKVEVVHFMGESSGDPILLYNNSSGKDFLKDTPIASIHLVGKDSAWSEEETLFSPDNELSAEITSIIKGEGQALAGTVKTSPPKISYGKCVFARVYFEGYDAFYWQGQIMAYENGYLLVLDEAIPSEGVPEETVIEQLYYTLPSLP